MKDMIGFLALAGAFTSGFAGVHFHGHTSIVLVGALLLVSAALTYVAWRSLVRGDVRSS